MKYLDLCRSYFNEYGKPMIEKDFPQISDAYAAGMAGEGSGCLGFDDEISQDHDFAPSFIIWLTDKDYEIWGADLQKAYDSLPQEYLGFSRSNIIDGSRTGVMRISDFYESFTGCPKAPESSTDWFLISEINLTAVSNGEIFIDKLGEFTRIRNEYLKFYPEDVLLKKLAARLCTISQAGQYNYSRCLKRNDRAAAVLALSRFSEAVISALYLMNKKPCPFYKWSFKGLSQFEDSDVKTISQSLEKLLADPVNPKNNGLIDDICTLLLKKLSSKGYISPETSLYAEDYAGQLMGKIKDSYLASLHPMADCL